MIKVSPFHQIELNDRLSPLIEHPPEHDYVIHQVSQKVVNGQPLIQGELVIAGADTLAEYPLAVEYPVHFRKTYYPVCFHQDPAHEFENHLAASKIIAVPAPIGSTRTTFRSCFLPGTPFDRLSPYGAEPPQSNIQIADDQKLPASIGLWYLLESVHAQTLALHENGFVHGDLFLHNVIVSSAPVGAHLIDFELAAQRSDDEMSDEKWQEKTRADLVEMLKHAIYLQCALGRQVGALAEASFAALPDLFKDGDIFLRSIDRRTRRG